MTSSREYKQTGCECACSWGGPTGQSILQSVVDWFCYVPPQDLFSYSEQHSNEPRWYQVLEKFTHTSLTYTPHVLSPSTVGFWVVGRIANNGKWQIVSTCHWNDAEDVTLWRHTTTLHHLTFTIAIYHLPFDQPFWNWLYSLRPAAGSYQVTCWQLQPAGTFTLHDQLKGKKWETL